MKTSPFSSYFNIPRNLLFRCCSSKAEIQKTRIVNPWSERTDNLLPTCINRQRRVTLWGVTSRLLHPGMCSACAFVDWTDNTRQLSHTPMSTRIMSYGTQGSSHKLLIKITVRGERFGLTVTLVVINWFVPIVLSTVWHYSPNMLRTFHIGIL